jgi:hypothetical protein
MDEILHSDQFVSNEAADQHMVNVGRKKIISEELSAPLDCTVWVAALSPDIEESEHKSSLQAALDGEGIEVRGMRISITADAETRESIVSAAVALKSAEDAVRATRCLRDNMFHAGANHSVRKHDRIVMPLGAV